MIEVHSLVVGPISANCHILHHAETAEAVVVDPGDDAPVILEFLQRIGARVVAIWNTHAHIDHINANAAVKAATGAAISIHRGEADWLPSPAKTLAVWAGVDFHPSEADHLWEDGQELTVLGEKWFVHHTPGHSPGMCCIVCPAAELMLSGDLLFRSSIGRTDLPGGDPDAMEQSLARLFGDWGRDSWRVYSGHGGPTTIGQERRTNPFVNVPMR